VNNFQFILKEILSCLTKATIMIQKLTI